MKPFPFSAIVGLQQAKKSLIYHALDPRLGGALFSGHRGCAKSTLVRAFAALLCTRDGRPAPFCEVPLGISEDRLLGSVDAESLVEKQQWQTRIGLLEKAHEGILYIDEVNLLPDHLSDLILDSAASGVHRLERDGIARVVESRYILVGTMNPEEGELRPQLLDRFAHGVRIKDDFSEQERMDIVQRRMDFDDDPVLFHNQFEREENRLRQRIEEAQTRLKDVIVSEEHRREIARRGHDLHVEGIRTELAVLRTARTSAAWRGRSEISSEDIEEAWSLCLGHRRDDLQPPTPPPLSSSNHQPGRSSPRPAATSSSPAPLQSREQEIPLRNESAIPSHNFARWCDRLTITTKPRPGPGHSAHTDPRAPVSWLNSVLVSAKAGWPSAAVPFRLCRSRLTRKKEFWIFLDASRSTGMTGFLARAQALLQGSPLRIEGRAHILLLQNNRLRWLARNSSWSRARRALAEVTTASGGSHLAEALLHLNRSMLRKRHVLSSAVLITDGLNRRQPGESMPQSFARMKRALHRVQATASAGAWIYPAPVAGTPQLAQRLLDKFEGTRFQL
jgi:Mg-chelatase subunit ChlI